MTNEEFKYWINGYLLLTDDLYLDLNQIIIIKNHANLVKSISGELDQNINHFINRLKKLSKKDVFISLLIVKKYALSSGIMYCDRES